MMWTLKLSAAANRSRSAVCLRSSGPVHLPFVLYKHNAPWHGTPVQLLRLPQPLKRAA